MKTAFNPDLLNTIIACEDPKLITEAINKGYDINALVDKIYTPLTYIIEYSSSFSPGILPLVREFILKGANINPANVKITPLTAAILADHQPIILYLLCQSAEVNPEHEVTFTPLSAAIFKKQKDLAYNLMREYTGNANLNPSNCESSPLECAIKIRDAELTEFILKNGKFNQADLVKTLLLPLRLFNEKSSQEMVKIIHLLKDNIKDINAEFILNGKKMNLLEVLFGNCNKNNTSIKFIFNKFLDSINADHMEKSIPELTNINSNIRDVIKKFIEKNNNIDWNQPLEINQDNLLMQMAKRGNYDLMKVFLEYKDNNGLPIFKINYLNANREKLIDYYRSFIDLDKSYFDIIYYLRAKGSSEPKNPIFSVNNKLNAEHIHNMKNTKIFEQMRGALHEKYYLTDQQVKDTHQDLKDYMILHKEHLISMLSEDRYNSLLENCTYCFDITRIAREGDTRFILSEDIAYVWLEAKALGREEIFLGTLPELYGCNWGLEINMYKVIEDNTIENKSVIDFTVYQAADEKADSAINKIFDIALAKLSEKLEFNNSKIQEVIYKFYQDVTINSNDFSKFSIGSEVVLSIFHEILIELARENGKNETDIFSDDISTFFNIIQFGISDYDLFDNKFFQIIKYCESEMLDVASDNNDELSDSDIEFNNTDEALFNELIGVFKYHD